MRYDAIPGPSWQEKGSATAFDEAKWFVTMQKGLHMDELVRKHATIMDRYDPGKRVALIVDEWGTWYDVEPGTNPGFLYQQNTLRDALVAGLSLNIFNNHADRVRMANIAQTVNVLQALILTDGPRMLTTPTYHVFDMYKAHQDATLLPCQVACDSYDLNSQKIPRLSVSASRDADGRVNLTLCNLHPRLEMEARCDLRGHALEEAEGSVLTADAMNAHNTFADPDRVSPADFTQMTLQRDRIVATLPPMSVVSLSIHVGS